MKEYNLDKNGNVIEKAADLLKLGRMKSRFPILPVEAYDSYAFCKSCFHYDACMGMDVEDHMCDLNECENHISVMTPEEFAEKMESIQVELADDVEKRHMDMDGLMMQVLTALGYSKGIDIFRSTDMWYA